MGVFVFQAEDGIRDAHWGLEFRRVLFRSRAVIWAVRRTPMVNAAWVDGEDGAQIRLHHYVNLGIAAATPRGLLVPNIKDAQDLSMRELARALQKLTTTAREGKATPADQQGGPRSEERRVGQECVSTCSSRWSPSH